MESDRPGVIRDPWLRALVVLGCAIATAYLLSLVWQVVQQIAWIVLLFFLAWLVAFILDPVVVMLVRFARVPRLLAIATAYLVLLVVIVTAVLLLMPPLTAQVVEVARNTPTYTDEATRAVMRTQTQINQWLVARHSPLYLDIGSALNPTDLAKRAEAAAPLLSNVIQVATGLATALLQLVLLMVLSFYFMADGRALFERFVHFLPERLHPHVRLVQASIQRAFAGFLRGQLLQALVGGIGTFLILVALKVQFALLAAVLATILLLIPLLGPVLGVAAPVLIAILTHDGSILLLLVLLAALQQVVFNGIGPRILGQQLGLHPLLVFFAVLVGTQVAGIWGAIFGVPVLAALISTATFYRSGGSERAARLQPYLPSAAPQAPAPNPPREVVQSR